MALIFWLSSFPAPGSVKDAPIIFKVKIIHLIEYGLLSFFFWLPLSKIKALKPGDVASLAIMLTILYGATDELHQVFVPFRTGNNIDLVVNGAAAAIVQLGILFYMKRKPQATV